MQTIPIQDVICDERVRELSVNHVDSLCASILQRGLMQPIVVLSYKEPRLVAGCHRLEAYKKLNQRFGTHLEIPCVALQDYLIAQKKISPTDTLSKADLLIYEVEENVKRLSMTWQDRVVAVAKYHKLQSGAAARRGESWAQEQTGELLGLDQSNVSRALIVAKRIRKEPDGLVAKAASLKEAILLILKERQAEAAKVFANKLKEKRKQIEPSEPATVVSTNEPKKEDDSAQPKSSSDLYSMQDVSEFFHVGDCLELLPKLAEKITINHIITDPPYAINMENLNMEGLEK
ncbi:MAG: ParB N-terminal domain-containing protein [Leptolyngbyaceae cyanobacterium RM2_2_4]|nr:ParB N-terminal domain-containing protein [Leptolyngbyaceae cyanobacterium RM2_2_4]